MTREYHESSESQNRQSCKSLRQEQFCSDSRPDSAVACYSPAQRRLSPHSLANAKRNSRYNSEMARCRVSFTDQNGIPHAVEVQADSLYEAVAMAVAEFRTDPLSAVPGAMTEFTVTIPRPAIEHRVRLSQVAKWADTTTREGPAGITKRQRVKALLGD